MQTVQLTTKGLSLQKQLEGVTVSDVDAVTLKDARQLWTMCGGPHSVGSKIISPPSANTKTAKAVRDEYILHLAPHRVAGVRSVCPWSTAGCRAVCLYSSGRGKFEDIQTARIARTKFATLYPAEFLALIRHEIRLLNRKYEGKKIKPFFRFNGTSDIAIERVPVLVDLINSCKSVEWADYTKANTAQRPNPTLDNYRLVRSIWADKPVTDLRTAITNGERIAICVTNKEQLLEFDFVADADRSDEWMFNNAVTIGLLSPKFPATNNDAWQASTVIDQINMFKSD